MKEQKMETNTAQQNAVVAVFKRGDQIKFR